MISLSHHGMISLMDNVAEGHDEEILEWQDEFSQMLSMEINKLSTNEVGILTFKESKNFLSTYITRNLEKVSDTFIFVMQKETMFSQSIAPPTLSSSLPAEVMETEEMMDTESTFNVSDFTSPVLNTPEAPQFSPVTPSASTPEQVSTPVSPSTSNQHLPPHTSTPTAPVTPTTAQEDPTGHGSKKTSSKHGVKVVGDNIDKNLRPRHQTIEKQTQSLHYFNCFACLDRVDLSGLSDLAPIVDIKSIDIKVILPSSEDLDQLLSNFAVIATRILVEHVPALAKFAGITTDHIKHERYDEMSKKSKVVRCLDVANLDVWVHYIFHCRYLLASS